MHAQPDKSRPPMTVAMTALVRTSRQAGRMLECSAGQENVLVRHQKLPDDLPVRGNRGKAIDGCHAVLDTCAVLPQDVHALLQVLQQEAHTPLTLASRPRPAGEGMCGCDVAFSLQRHAAQAVALMNAGILLSHLPHSCDSLTQLCWKSRADKTDVRPSKAHVRQFFLELSKPSYGDPRGRAGELSAP